MSTTTKRYQIIRMGDGKTAQYHYDRQAGKFMRSVDRWDGEFIATADEARALYAAVASGYRPNRGTSKPMLYTRSYELGRRLA